MDEFLEVFLCFNTAVIVIDICFNARRKEALLINYNKYYQAEILRYSCSPQSFFKLGFFPLYSYSRHYP